MAIPHEQNLWPFVHVIVDLTYFESFGSNIIFWSFGIEAYESQKGQNIFFGSFNISIWERIVLNLK